MSIARLGEAIENPSVTQIMAAYPSKKAFDAAVQQGKIKPTTEAGVVANIYNRIVNEALAQQGQTETTVFQDNTQSAPQMGLAAAQQMQGQPAGPGLDQIPVPEQMFNAPQGMAGGGIVAFQSAGFVADRRLLNMMNGQERAEYQRTGKIPERIQSLMQSQAASGEAYGGADSVFARPTVNAPIDMTFNNAAFTPTPRGRVAAAPSGASNLPSTAQTAAQQAAVPTPEPTIEDLVKQDLEMRNRILGEDPTRARLKALYEKQEKSAEEDSRKDQAMRLIEAGLGIAGGTSPYFAANLAGATPALKGYGEDVRARRKEATERAKGMAELEGMERREKAEVLTQTMAQRREEKKTQEAYKNQEKLARLQASLKRDAEDVLLDPKSTTEEKQRAREVLTLKRSLGGASSSMPKLSFEDAMKAAETQYGFNWQKMSPEDKAKAADIIYRKYNAGTGTWGEMTVSGGK